VPKRITTLQVFVDRSYLSDSLYGNYFPRITLWIAFTYKQTHLLTCKILDEWEDRRYVGPCNRAQNIQTSCTKIIPI